MKKGITLRGVKGERAEVENGVGGKDYLYNGKELADDFGLDWHFYGFRMYDAVIGRFPSVDPIADEFAFVSPFNYAENSPIRHIDLWGLQKEDKVKFDKFYPPVMVDQPRTAPKLPKGKMLSSIPLSLPKKEATSPSEIKQTTVSSFSEILSASINGTNVANVSGQALEAIKNDPDFIKNRNTLINDEIKNMSGNSKYGTFTANFGKLSNSFFPSSNDPAWLSHTEQNIREMYSKELFWMIGNATIAYHVEVNKEGDMSFQYKLIDFLDLRPGNRSAGYNAAMRVSGFLYHDVIGGNEDMQTRAEWSETIQSSDIEKIKK